MLELKFEKSGINTSGKVVVRIIYDGANYFASGLAAVRVGEKWGYINASGKVVVPFQFDSAKFPFGGLAVVGVGEKYGYIKITFK